MRGIVLAACGIALAASVPPAASGEGGVTCDWAVMAIAARDVAVAYVLHDPHRPAYYDPLSLNARVYVESNGLPGPQRGGPSALLGDFDSCDHGLPPDTYVF